MSAKYTNPIISSFSPDPSVTFYDGTFFLVNSSFHIFPGIPINASKDLNSWTQIGSSPLISENPALIATRECNSQTKPTRLNKSHFRKIPNRSREDTHRHRWTIRSNDPPTPWDFLCHLHKRLGRRTEPDNAELLRHNKGHLVWRME